MCRGCQDLDRRAELEREGIACDGTQLETGTLVELQEYFEQKWRDTKKTRFRCDERSLLDSDQDSVTWNAIHPETREKATITIRFEAA